jgi:hypothetical protein
MQKMLAQFNPGNSLEALKPEGLNQVRIDIHNYKSKAINIGETS